MGATPPNRQYSRFIVTSDVWPTTREACEVKASAQRRVANATASAADTHRGALNGLRAGGVAESTGFEAMHQAYWRFQVEADDKAEIDSAAADLLDNIATIQHGAEQRIDSIDADAHKQLASVPNRSPQAIGIITGAATMARGTAVGAAEEITALSGQFGKRFGPIPESPASSDPESRGDSDRSTDKRTDETPEPPHGTAAESSGGTQRRTSTPEAPEPGSVFGNTVPRVGPGQPLAPSSSPHVPSSPSTGRGPTAALGGIGSGGGGLGGGASSLSSSGSPGGLGGLGSGLLGSGSGGAASPTSPATSSASSPTAAFSRALPVVSPTSFASGAGGASSPATTAAPPPVGASTAPLMTASPSGASHAPPVAAAPHVVTPQSLLGTPGAGSSAPAQPVGAPAAALLPPGPMGPPPAVPAASAAAAPAVGPAAAMAPATASVAATAVATPVATLPSRVAAAAARDFERLRNESSDLQTVKRLAWQLLAASESGRSFALWAVGVMYSATGERQVVAVSHHGAGYVPPGIAVPTDLRMAWSDPIISDAFRQRWTGNLDPAATLVAYAELKAGEAAAWRLGAAATTWAEVDAFMAAAQRWGTEWATCSGMNMPGCIEKQALMVGAESTHRLAGEFPVLAKQVAELNPRGLDHRVAKLITDALVTEARLVVTSSTMPGESRFPANFDDVWPAAAESTVAAAERARFAEAVQQQWLNVGIAQPGWDLERSASIDTEYRGQWLISRTLEAVLGWIADSGSASKPAELPMADIVYAAAHAHLDGRGTGWITDLFAEAEKSSR